MAAHMSSTVQSASHESADFFSRLPLVNEQDGYYTIPSTEELHRMSVSELKCVVDFTVGRSKFGEVRFLGQTNLLTLRPLMDLIQISLKEVAVYENEKYIKPSVGEELNKPAIIILHQIFPSSSITKEEYAKKVEERTVSMGANFIQYDPDKGDWIFRVPHFTKYGILDESKSAKESAHASHDKPSVPQAPQPLIASRPPLAPARVKSDSIPGTLLKPPEDGVSFSRSQSANQAVIGTDLLHTHSNSESQEKSSFDALANVGTNWDKNDRVEFRTREPVEKSFGFGKRDAKNPSLSAFETDLSVEHQISEGRKQRMRSALFGSQKDESDQMKVVRFYDEFDMGGINSSVQSGRTTKGVAGVDMDASKDIDTSFSDVNTDFPPLIDPVPRTPVTSALSSSFIETPSLDPKDYLRRAEKRQRQFSPHPSPHPSASKMDETEQMIVLDHSVAAQKASIKSRRTISIKPMIPSAVVLRSVLPPLSRRPDFILSKHGISSHTVRSMDPFLSLHRSFRVGWGAQGQLVRLGAWNAQNPAPFVVIDRVQVTPRKHKTPSTAFANRAKRVTEFDEEATQHPDPYLWHTTRRIPDSQSMESILRLHEPLYAPQSECHKFYVPLLEAHMQMAHRPMGMDDQDMDDNFDIAPEFDIAQFKVPMSAALQALIARYRHSARDSLVQFRSQIQENNPANTIFGINCAVWELVCVLWGQEMALETEERANNRIFVEAKDGHLRYQALSRWLEQVILKDSMADILAQKDKELNASKSNMVLFHLILEHRIEQACSFAIKCEHYRLATLIAQVLHKQIYLLFLLFF